MNKKDTSNMMKIMGATLAVCSAAAIMGGMKTNSFSAKKTMKKAGYRSVVYVRAKKPRKINQGKIFLGLHI